MEATFSPSVKDVILYSKEEAIRLGNDYIGSEHLLLGIIRSKDNDGFAVPLLLSLGVELEKLKNDIEDTVRQEANQITALSNIPLTKQAEKIITTTYLEAKLYKSDIIKTEHLLLSILRDKESGAFSILSKYNVGYRLVIDEMVRMSFIPEQANDSTSFWDGFEKNKADYESLSMTQRLERLRRLSLKLEEGAKEK